MGMALAFTYFKSFGQCFAKAMVQRISILLLRRSRKLSKFRTPLRTPVAKHYIWRQSNSDYELPSYLTLWANRIK